MAARKWASKFIALFLLLLLAGGFGLWSWWQWVLKPYSDQGKTELVAILPGSNAAQVAKELEQRQLIRSGLVFRVLSRQNNVDVKLYVGEYLISSSMSPEEIIKRLIKGPESTAVRVTIPEGYTTEQIIGVLAQKGLGTKEEFQKVLSEGDFKYSFLEGASKGPERLDGYLFPDTYFIDRKSSPQVIIDTFLKRFEREVTPEVRTQLKAMKMSVRDWVILASVVEKEAVQESDRTIIAAVFINRLIINMPLQSCATIQYILGTPKPKLYDKDLQIPSPYNTYLNTGLPPGPIASPGHASLQATLNPAQTDYLYFLAKSDGYHVFAKTFAEHLRNQKQYQ